MGVMDQQQCTAIEELHQLVADTFHAGGVLLVLIMALTQDIDDDQLGLTRIEGLSYDGLCFMCQYIDMYRLIIRVEHVEVVG
jgi:hypothetical protein